MPDPSEPQEQELAAVLFADVSGSTRLYETAGDAVAVKAIDDCIAVMRRKTEAAGGRVVKTIGDEVMAIFRQAEAAGQAAMEMQVGISELPRVGRTQLGIRVGLHFGPVVERDGDVFGDTVNLAARLSGLATKGQIITTRDTVNRFTPMLKGSCRQLYKMSIKGKEDEIEICELLWRVAEDATTLASDRSGGRTRSAWLRMLHDEAELRMGDDRTTLTLGRDPASDVVIRDRGASRNHAKIERRMGKFVLADHSANGTFVTVEGDREVVLQREEFTLRGHGWIAFGQSRKTATEFVEFFCE